MHFNCNYILCKYHFQAAFVQHFNFWVKKTPTTIYPVNFSPHHIYPWSLLAGVDPGQFQSRVRWESDGVGWGWWVGLIEDDIFFPRLKMECVGCKPNIGSATPITLLDPPKLCSTCSTTVHSMDNQIYVIFRCTCTAFHSYTMVVSLRKYHHWKRKKNILKNE